MAECEILGIRYRNVTLQQAARDVMELAAAHESRYVVTPNPEISECCVKNSALRQAVQEADYIVPDGIGVILASRICGTPLQERVSGYDLALALLPLIEKARLRLFLLGAKPGVAAEAAEKIRAKYPQIPIVGVEHGYFSDDAAIIRRINDQHADVLFVALGSPKQEIWMHAHRQTIRTGVMIGLGGSFDVLAGRTTRAPQFWIDHNLEWLYRLAKEPSRFVRMLKLPRYILRACMVQTRKMSTGKSKNES